MSLLDKASLVLTPNGYKESKLYSFIPSSGLGDMTVARSTTATRVNEAGFIEETPYNLLSYSEQFDNGTWTKYNTTVTANTTISPNGQLTADKLIENASNSNHEISQQRSGFLIGNSYTFSFFAKAGERTFTRINSNGAGFGTQDYAVYDLSLGIVKGKGTNGTANIQNVGNGWFRCIRTITAISSGNWSMFVGLSTGLDVRGESYQGDGTSGIYIWGGQIEQGSVAKPYFPTTTRLNVPQIDYTDGCPSILIEPQRTNLLTYSNDFSTFNNSQYWVLNNEISPDGTMNASTLTFTGVNQYTNKSTSIGVGVICSSSVYVKGNLNETIIFNCGGVDKVHTLTGDWQRLKTENKTSVNSTVAFSTYGGVSGRQFLVYGSQLEVGSYATSYIPTVASTVTRNATAVILNNSQTLPSSYPFTLYTEAKFNDNYDTAIALIDSSRTDSFYSLRFLNNKIQGVIRPNTSESILTSSDNFSINTYYKIAITITDTTVNLFVNGVFQGSISNTALFLSGINDLLIGQTRVLSDTLSRNSIKSAIVFKTELTDTECIALTTI